MANVNIENKAKKNRNKTHKNLNNLTQLNIQNNLTDTLTNLRLN